MTGASDIIFSPTRRGQDKISDIGIDIDGHAGWSESNRQSRFIFRHIILFYMVKYGRIALSSVELHLGSNLLFFF